MAKVNIKLPAPHSVEQAMIFKALNTPGLQEVWVACGTKFGKTLGAGGAISYVLPIKKQCRYRWVAPIYSQALIGARYVKRMLPPEPYTQPQEYSIKIPYIDSVLEFRTGEKPENLEGEACHGYVLDECSKMKEQVYASAKTTTTITGGPILAISTPRGKNWFYTKCMDAKAEMLRAEHEGRQPKQIFITAPTSANPFVKPETIAEYKKNLPERLFRQYYLAEFMEDSATFMGYRDCFYTEPLNMYEDHQKWCRPEAKKATVVIGVDWAKTVDWTVFIAICVTTRAVVAFERFHKRPYTEAIKMLVRFNRQFQETMTIFHDKTGVGEAINDQLSYTDLPYEGVTFTNRSKTDMVNNLITAIERKAISIPKWNVLDSEMDAYEVTTNSLGTMSYSAPSGQHDDTVSALMLANSALHQYTDNGSDIRFLEDLASEEPEKWDPDSLEAYYNDLKEDEDFG